MARIRSLKPEAPQHRKVGRLSIWARWLWLVMVTQADDEGRLPADAGQLRLLAFGYDEDVTAAKVADWLAEIAQTGLIVRYDVRNVPYAYFPSWKEHQRIDRPRPSKYPPPPELRSTKPRRSLADPSSRALRGSDQGSEGSRIKDRKGGEPEGRETHTAGDASPAPPRVSLPPPESQSQDNGHSARRRTPAKGDYQDLLHAVKTRRPHLSTAEAEEEALKQYNEHLLGARR